MMCLQITPKHPADKELVEDFPKVQYIAGGATQNTIRVAQWMIGKPGVTSYIGCIGKDDDFGKQLRKSATADGVSVHYREDAEKPTGTCAVLINEKERSLCANLSAANEYKMEDHFNTEEIQAVVKASKMTYSAGFFLTVCPDAMVAAGKLAAESTDKVFCFNLSAPFLCQFFKEQMHQVLPYADYVFGNESEAAAFAEANGFKGATVPEVALKISMLPKASGTRGRVVVITQGSEQTVVAKDGKVVTYDVPAVPAEEIVDVNGAGDSFVGGFLAKLLEGADLAECVRAGHWAAGVIIRTSGCVLPAKCEFA